MRAGAVVTASAALPPRPRCSRDLPEGASDAGQPGRRRLFLQL